jgi:hypothetical protein
MKLIEAMNTLKLTDKKLRQKTEFLQKYAARPTFKDDVFNPKNPAEGEMKKVGEAKQAADDLIKQHAKLKRDIDYTNLVTYVEVVGKRYAIHELILQKRLLCKLKRNVLSSLNDNVAQMEVNQLRMRGDKESKVNVQVFYNYDIQKKEEELDDLNELESNIDSALQIANAKIELVECPDGKK